MNTPGKAFTKWFKRSSIPTSISWDQYKAVEQIARRAWEAGRRYGREQDRSWIERYRIVQAVDSVANRVCNKLLAQVDDEVKRRIATVVKGEMDATGVFNQSRS